MKKTLTLFAAVLALAAGIDPLAAAPVLTSEDQCASCGMWITKYPGPKGALEFEDGQVLKYCSARGAVCGMLEALKAGKRVKTVWMHDVADNDWKRPKADTMVDVRDAWFVYGSLMKAVMGPSLAAFRQERDARAFQKTYGGTIYRLEDLTAEVLGCKAKY